MSILHWRATLVWNWSTTQKGVCVLLWSTPSCKLHNHIIIKQNKNQTPSNHICSVSRYNTTPLNPLRTHDLCSCCRGVTVKHTLHKSAFNPLSSPDRRAENQPITVRPTFTAGFPLYSSWKWVNVSHVEVNYIYICFVCTVFNVQYEHLMFLRQHCLHQPAVSFIAIFLHLLRELSEITGCYRAFFASHLQTSPIFQLNTFILNQNIRWCDRKAEQ